jgi:hypothetical protein
MESILECSFLIPVRRDSHLSEGSKHDPSTWQLVYRELFERFGGGTRPPGTYQGFYKDSDSGEQVSDESFKFVVAVTESRLPELRGLLRAFTIIFQQKCIYLSVAGRVEFVEFPS